MNLRLVLLAVGVLACAGCGRHQVQSGNPVVEAFVKRLRQPVTVCWDQGDIVDVQQYLTNTIGVSVVVEHIHTDQPMKELSLAFNRHPLLFVLDVVTASTGWVWHLRPVGTTPTGEPKWGILIRVQPGRHGLSDGADFTAVDARIDAVRVELQAAAKVR